MRQINPPGLWSPKSDLRLVGVQVAYVPSNCIRVVKWRVIASLFCLVDKALGQRLLKRLVELPGPDEEVYF